jgi:hypothetical protein
MKRGTIDHPKTRLLASALHGLPRYCVVGILETLWHFAALYAHRGDVGRFPNEALAEWIGWADGADELVRALISSGWLDEVEDERRLVVHDWLDHCEDSVRKRLDRDGQRRDMSRHVRTCPDKSGNVTPALSVSSASASAVSSASASARAIEEPEPDTECDRDPATETTTDAATTTADWPYGQCTNEEMALENAGTAQGRTEATPPVSEPSPAPERAPKPRSERFVKPTIEEVAKYCAERGGLVDPEAWMDFYTSNGWKIGKNPMKDWRAAVRTWERDRRTGAKRETEEQRTARLWEEVKNRQPLPEV